MALHLWIGPAGSGKTFRCLAALRQCERDGRRALLLVPEQFTYAADRLLLGDPDLPGTRFVRVLSFRRLAQLAAERLPQTRVVTEEGRRLLLRRIVHGTAPETLGPLAPVRNTPGFVDALAHAIREAKGIAGAEAAARLTEAAGQNPKAAAVARLLVAYDAALQHAGMADPGEAVHEIAARLRRDPGPWGGLRVWVDGFVGFTPEERALLQTLARIAGELTVTVCADAQDARLTLERAAEVAAHGIGPTSARFLDALRPMLQRPGFLPTLRTLVWVDQSLAGARRVEYLPPGGTLPARFAGAEDLARLEDRLFRTEMPTPPRDAAGPSPVVAWQRFPTPYHEVVGWARWIDRRARLSPEPYRFRDIAVLVRDLEAYRPLVPEIFARYGIPVFIDQRRDATAHPLVRLCLSALRLAQGWTREAVVSMLRNPLLGLPPETVDRIENLSLEYGIEYERWWLTDWNVPALPPRDAEAEEGTDPTGEDHGEEIEATDNGSLSRRDRRARGRRRAAESAAQVARRFFPAWRAFTEIWRKEDPPFAEVAEALQRLLRDLAGDAISASVPGGWTTAESQQVVQRFQETIAAGLDLMPRVPMRAELFTRVLKDSLGHASIGAIPQVLDAVIVAEPRRSRVDQARGVILGGLVAGAFPRMHSQDPLFSDAEREQLARAGFPIAARAQAQAEEEPYLFYIAVTRASRELLLTAPSQDERGATTQPSSYLIEVARALGFAPGAPAGVAPAPDAVLEACQHTWELGATVARQLRGGGPEDARELTRWADDHLPSAADTVAHAARLASRLRSETAERLPAPILAALHPGFVLTTSASGLESFARCPFLYFAGHVLRLEPRPEAVLTPLSTGGAVHAALERFFAGRGAGESDDDAAARMRAIFRDLADEEDFRAFQIDPPSAYRWALAGRHLEHFIRAEQRRLSRSLFQPAVVELEFGSGKEGAAETVREALRRGDRVESIALPPLEIALDAAGPLARWSARLRGRIDRLDLHRPTPDRMIGLVVDYKSKAHAVAPHAGLSRGFDLQVAAYLLAVREVLGIEIAGGVYYSVSPRPHGPDDPVRDANRLRFGMQGFVTESARTEVDPEEAFELKATPDAGGDLSRTLRTAREQIAGFAARILQGEIRPDPRSSGGRLPCAYCEYRGMCRYDASIVTREPEESE